MINYKLILPNKKVRLVLLNVFRFIPDKIVLLVEYYIRFGKKLNLDNPTTFTEKLQWLKLYDRKDNYTIMVDKLNAKKFITDVVGAGHVVPVLGSWEKFEDIDFSSLPEQFVLKCTHDSGSVMFCKDKSLFDYKKAKKHFSFHLRNSQYLLGREWPYKNVPRKIIAEPLFSEETGAENEGITDYKFFCFDGTPEIMYISNDKGLDPRTDFFDMNFVHLPIRMKDPNADVTPKKPKQFDEMKEMARKLSQGIPHLRVDFYVLNEKIYVGELTFFHNSGFTAVNPPEWNLKMGDWIKLPNVHLGKKIGLSK